MGQDLQVGVLPWSITIGLIVVLLAMDLEFILAFIGVKLVLHRAHVDLDPPVLAIPTAVSLGVILLVLVIVTVASLIKTRRDPTVTAHAGSLRATRSSHVEEHTPADRE